MLETVQHIFLPRHSNSFKAKLIRFEGLLAIGALLIIFQSILQIASVHTSVLGYAANISTDEVIRLTNAERSKLGLNELDHNSALAEAAALKGADMLENNYWAHISPDGTEPWDFFRSAGYEYRYAGENLARDFSSPVDAVSAWMASPSHKENMLSDKYNEIGIAVVEGDMNGEDTTIIVQLFGTSAADRLPVVPVAAAVDDDPQPETIVPEVNAQENVAIAVVKPDLNLTISPFVTTKNVSIALLFVLSAVLVIDLFYIEYRGIARKNSSRIVAHLSFFAMIIIILIIARAGEII